jgi:hypothetical protein
MVVVLEMSYFKFDAQKYAIFSNYQYQGAIINNI